MILLVCGTSFAANKSKQNKNKDAVKTSEGWYVYRYVSSNGFKNTRQSECVSTFNTPGDVARRYDKTGTDYQIIDRLSKNDKPIIVDIITGESSTHTGYDYSYTNEYIYVSRYVRSSTLCWKVLENDSSGKLDEERYGRYK